MVFTWNNYPSDAKEKLVSMVEEGICRYVVAGFESAPTTGTPHLQGYLVWTNPKTLSAACKMIPHCSFQVRRGSHHEARAYCIKDGNYFEEGLPPKDVTEIREAQAEEWQSWIDLAIAGRIAEIPPQAQVRYYNSWKSIAKDRMRVVADAPTCCGIWIQGPAGCGKSRMARKLAMDANLAFFSKPVTKWWDGYASEPVVICDDISVFHVDLGTCVKHWTDRYAFVGESKGGALRIRPRWVILTTQYHIDEIWSDRETIDAIRRRVYVLNYFDKSSGADSATLELVNSYFCSAQQ